MIYQIMWHDFTTFYLNDLRNDLPWFCHDNLPNDLPNKTGDVPVPTNTPRLEPRFHPIEAGASKKPQMRRMCHIFIIYYTILP
jgi:hypothetical protein